MKILILVLVAAVVGGVLIFAVRDSSGPELTREEALALLQLTHGCIAKGVPEVYRSCSVDIVRSDGGWTVTVIHDGFYDDSVRASRLVVEMTYLNGRWQPGEPVITQLCHEGRGQQDFTSDLCI